VTSTSASAFFVSFSFVSISFVSTNFVSNTFGLTDRSAVGRGTIDTFLAGSALHPPEIFRVAADEDDDDDDDGFDDTVADDVSSARVSSPSTSSSETSLGAAAFDAMSAIRLKLLIHDAGKLDPNEVDRDLGPML
jgi:hypothetical protein